MNTVLANLLKVGDICKQREDVHLIRGRLKPYYTLAILYKQEHIIYPAASDVQKVT